MDDPPRIGLIGFGAFGRLACEHLARRAHVSVHDPIASDREIRLEGGTPVSLDDAAASDAVVLAVPVQAMRDALDAIAPRVREGAVVADVASVKVRPVEWMLERIPPHAHVLGTHPLFGPQTAQEHAGIAGEPIAICPARIDDASLARARALLGNALGLRVVERTPDEHDREMARVQVVTHLIGHAASDMNLPELDTATVAYRRLMQMKRNTEHDSEELFDAIQRLNPHAAPVRRAFLDALARVVDRADAQANSQTDGENGSSTNA